LIVVIAILGILAAIAVPRLAGFRDKAIEEGDYTTAAIVGKAASMYIASDPSVKYGDAIEMSDIKDYLEAGADTKYSDATEPTISYTEDDGIQVFKGEGNVLYPRPTE